MIDLVPVEQELLGGLLIEPRLIDDAMEIVRPDDFLIGVHARIFEAITKERESTGAISTVAVSARISGDDGLSEIEDPDGYVSRLVDFAVLAGPNILRNARLVREWSDRRLLISDCEDAIKACHDGDLEEAIAALLGARLTERAADFDSGGFRHVRSGVGDAIAQTEAAIKGASNGLTTGLVDLNRIVGGFRKAELTILAGRPAMGKTALALNMAVAAAQEGAKVGFFSLEMSEVGLATRLLSMETSINLSRIVQGRLNQHEFDTLVSVQERFQELPLFLDDQPSLSITKLFNRARRLQRKEGLDIVFVDYLQLARGNDQRQRHLEVQEVSQGLKGLAKTAEIPVVALSQLSRRLEDREDKRPVLSDLRESGSIEQDADNVLFAYRESYYHEHEEPDPQDPRFSTKLKSWERGQEVKNIAEIIVAKQRQGATGTARVHFDASLTRFSNLLPVERAA